MPQRGCASMKAARTRTASGSGTASGLQTTISSPDVRANAAFRLAEYERGRSFSITRAPCRSAGRLPGGSRRRRARPPAAPAPGATDSSSRACPCETTTPEMRLAVAIDLHPVCRPRCSNRASSSGSNDSRQPPIWPLRNVGLALEKSRSGDALGHAPGRGGRRSRGSSAPACRRHRRRARRSAPRSARRARRCRASRRTRPAGSRATAPAGAPPRRRGSRARSASARPGRSL